ncbi:MAG: ATP-binding cassette domain-containing protein [Deltaproteobacteria bacterium]|nr:ATP-binding cassette domain-containing protein [Deltaproteobacteria bacterium]
MTREKQTAPPAKIRLVDLGFAYGSQVVFQEVTAAFPDRAITAITGPSGQGKSTLLTTINRLWETVPGARLEGRVLLNRAGRWQNVYAPDIDPARLRRRVGMVFQAPNPLPMSIRKNLAFPLKIAGCRDRRRLEEKTEQALRQAFLWEEVRDRLDEDARRFSGGQQQRLCIARALVLEPEVLLLDEPTSSLDTAAAGVIEELLASLKKNCALVMVSHHPEQVRRLADRIFLLEKGRLRLV